MEQSEDIVEKPIRHTLVRQSSIEMRLYPEQDTGDLSGEESDNGTHNPEIRVTQTTETDDSARKPRVVSMIAKSKSPPPRRNVASTPVGAPVDKGPEEQRPLQERAQGTLDLRQAANVYHADYNTGSQIKKAGKFQSQDPALAQKEADQELPEYSVVDKKNKSTKTQDPALAQKEADQELPEYSVVDKKNKSSKIEATIVPEKAYECTDAGPIDSTLVIGRPKISTANSEQVKAKANVLTVDKVPEAQEENASVKVEPAGEQHKVPTITERKASEDGDVPAPTGEATLRRVRFNDEAEGEYAEINLPQPVFAASLKVQEVQDEGKYAIDSPGNPLAPDLPPEDYTLEENEERSMIQPHSYEDPKLRELMGVLIEWINDELASHRIIVKDLEEDLYDGQVLHKLIETLTSERLDVPEVTQSEEGQKQKLGVVLSTANRVLGLPRWSQQKWSVESVHSKNVISILHLLVALARHFRAPVRLPERVSVQVVVVQMHSGVLSHRTVTEEITSTYDDLGQRGERDAFDTLFDHAPDKLQVVKKSLVSFVNKHLNKLGLEVTDLDTQFHDGVYLALLMGLLEGFFVPLYAFHNTPNDFDQKVHNVNLAFDLMQDVGLARPKARPEDIVNLDLKSTLRVLYNLFTKYKSLA